jgi:hypothetical protein
MKPEAAPADLHRVPDATHLMAPQLSVATLPQVCWQRTFSAGSRVGEVGGETAATHGEKCSQSWWSAQTSRTVTG